MKNLKKTNLLVWVTIIGISFLFWYNVLEYFRSINLFTFENLFYIAYGFLLLAFAISFIAVIYSLIKEALKK